MYECMFYCKRVSYSVNRNNRLNLRNDGKKKNVESQVLGENGG